MADFCNTIGLAALHERLQSLLWNSAVIYTRASGHDYMHGSVGADQLNGLAGNDFLNGWDGNDALFGDDGAAWIVMARNPASGMPS